LLAVAAARADALGIPHERIVRLTAYLQAAEAALAIVRSSKRSAVDTAHCKLAFKQMEAEARYIKRHYLLSPPLTAADLRAVGLGVDDTRSPIGKPDGQPLISVSYPGGPHTHLLHLAPMPGTDPLNARGGFGYAIYRGIMPPGGATLEQAAGAKHYLMRVPLDGDELLYYRSTHRKTERVVFEGSEAGMTAFYCGRYENPTGDVGGWGPMAMAVVT
jgi:hypothetical protein